MKSKSETIVAFVSRNICQSFLRILPDICWVIALLLLLLSPDVSARWRPNNLLGGGGTNYSDSNPNHDGLHTGQYSGRRWMLGAYANGSYSTVFTDSHLVGHTNGFGTGGGLVTEFQNQSFLLQMGIGLRFQKLTTPVSDTTFLKYNVADSWTNQRDTFHYDMQFDFYNREDVCSLFYLELPILFGQAFDYSFFKGTPYYLVGFRLQTSFFQSKGWGATHVSAEGSTQAYYDRYFGIFREMDNHGMRKDVPIKRDGDKIRLKFDAVAHVEVGWELSPEQPRGYRIRGFNDWRIRLAAFADFGVVNINPRTDFNLCSVPDESKWDFPTYDFNHVFSSSTFHANWLSNGFFGIRLTVLFTWLTPETCIICGPYRDERDPGGSKHY